jgi:hypothetical protein
MSVNGGSVRGNNNDNIMNMLMNMNAAELAALENYAMSPGTPSHRNRIN